MNKEFKAKVNFYLQQNELEKAFSLLNQYREDTPEFQQLERLCLERLSELYLHLIKEHIQNNKFKEAKDLILQYRSSFGTNREIEELLSELTKPTWILKLRSLKKRTFENIYNMTVISGIKMLLLALVLCAMGIAWSIFAYKILLETDLSIKLEPSILFITVFVSVGIMFLFTYLIFSYVVQNRITQYRVLDDKYHRVEIVGLLIAGVVVPPLYYFYLYRFGFPVWKKTIGIGLTASICSFMSIFLDSFVLIGMLISLIYLGKLYRTAKKYNQ